MKLYEHFGRSGFHTSILTSFGIDFDAYENVVLARMRGAGCHNNLLVVDERMLTLALEGASQPPRFAGRLYSVAGAQAHGVFHPKIVLQLGKASGRLIVSSANVTSSGLAGNLEIAGLLSGGSESAGEARLIAAAWAFSSRFLPRQEDGIRQQVDWMLARTPWLRHTEPADGIVTLADGSAAAFMASGGSTGIAERFLAAIGGEPIERLVIISLYWDDELRALGFLLERTQAARTAILIDPLRHQFPAGGLQGNRRPELVAFGARDEKRFVHAKLVIAQTGSADHVLFGSANCTPAALGIEGFGGSNEEACLYRSLPPGVAVETLKLTETLGSAALDPERLPQVGGPEPIPLQELAGRNPGRFECRFDTLSWWPPPAVDPDEVHLELLAADRQSLEIELQPLSRRSDGAVRYRLVGAAGRPAFARVRYEGGGTSAPAIVPLLDELKAAVKDFRNRRLEVAIGQLDGETELGLWLLETLNEIEAAERASENGSGKAPERRSIDRQRGGEEEAAEPATLSYAEFVAGRRLVSDAGQEGRNSLAGSELSRVRGFLNRVLGLAASDNEPDFDEDALARSFDLGDETDDPAGALESGTDFSEPARPKQGVDDEAERQRQAVALQRRANREDLIRAVATLQERVAAKAKSDGLRTIDLLRLRAMLMVIATAGWDGESETRSVIQVLPPAGDMEAAWPRLLGKALFPYFGGTAAPIRTLLLDDDFVQLPEDVLECWATCMWAVQAITLKCQEHREYGKFHAGVEAVKQTIYLITALAPAELLDQRILRVFEALNGRFAKRLALDPIRLIAGHRRTADALRACAA